MSDATSIYFSLIYERHVASHPWIDWEWKVGGLMPVADSDIHRPARLLERGNRMTRWLAEPSRIDLHRTDVEAYIYNLTSPQPSIFSVSRAREESVAEGLTWEPQLITLSSYEAEEYQSGDDYLIGKQVLPADVQEWLEAFVALHFKDEPFKKRQRVRHDNEKHIFGQESLVELRARMLASGKSDGEKH